MRDCQEGNGKFKRRGIDQKPSAHALIPRFQKRLAVFDVGETIPRIRKKPYADLVTLSKRGLYPLWLHTTVISARVEVLLFEIAHCLWICSSFYSNFEKQNRKGSPTSLIYPYIGKLTSYVIKQFFTFGREHQTLSRSRLRRFCFVRYAHLRKTSTRAEKGLHCSHNNYIPHLLRMTKSAQCFWFKRSFAMPTSKTAGLF